MNKKGFAGIGLYNAKFPENVGSILRAAYCFDAAFVAITGKRYRRSSTDTPRGYRHLPLIQVDDLKTIIPYDCVPVAVEILPGKSRNIVNYIHPERAFYIFGAEDMTLGDKILSWCRDVIHIPTVSCLNLSAAVNIVLYDRLQKQTYQKKNNTLP